MIFYRQIKNKSKTTYSVQFIHSSRKDPKISVLSALAEGSLLSKFSITWLRNISFFRTKGCGQVKPSLISSSGSLETRSVSDLVLKNTRPYYYYQFTLCNFIRHFVNQHPTSRQTSHIPNIPHPGHPTSRTSHIPNIPHPEHPTF